MKIAFWFWPLFIASFLELFLCFVGAIDLADQVGNWSAHKMNECA
jgi:hypothetical protein